MITFDFTPTGPGLVGFNNIYIYIIYEKRTINSNQMVTKKENIF